MTTTPDEVDASATTTDVANAEIENRKKMIVACRILAAEGHSDNLAGQFTVRSTTNPNHFLTLPLGHLFGEVTESDICVINDELELVVGDRPVNPAVRFHLWIYRARPEVRCIVHTHAPYTAALSMAGRPLVVAHMDTAMFHEDCAYLSKWPGLPFGDDEGRIISECMGSRRSILLANHGYITTGTYVEEASYLAVFFERAAKMQLLVESMGEIQRIDPALAREAHDFLLSPDVVAKTFDAWARKTSTT